MTGKCSKVCCSKCNRVLGYYIGENFLVRIVSQDEVEVYCVKCAKEMEKE